VGLNTLLNWNEDPEFQALPAARQSIIYQNYFDGELADDEFRALPPARQNEIKSNFLQAHGSSFEPVEIEVEPQAPQGDAWTTDPLAYEAPPEEKFDPEGAGYDYDSAKAAGMGPDETGHWASRNPKTGQLLKGKKHDTWDLLEQGEKDAGYVINKGEDGLYYSRPEGQSQASRESESLLNRARNIGAPPAEDIIPEGETRLEQGKVSYFKNNIAAGMEQMVDSVAGSVRGIADVANEIYKNSQEPMSADRQQVLADLGLTPGKPPEKAAPADSKMLAKLSDNMKAFIDQSGEDIPELLKREGVKGWTDDVVKMIPQILSQAGAHAATGGIGSMFFMGSQIFGGTYNKLVDEDKVEPVRAAMAAFGNASMQAPLEAIGMGKALSVWKPGKHVTKVFKEIAETMGVEFVTEWLQAYPDAAMDIWGTAQKKGRSPSEQVDKFFTDFWDTTKAGMYEGSVAMVFGGASPAAKGIYQKFDPEARTREKIDTAITTQIEEALKTNNLSPEAARILIEEPFLKHLGPQIEELIKTQGPVGGKKPPVKEEPTTPDVSTQAAGETSAPPATLDDARIAEEDAKVDRDISDSVRQDAAAQKGIDDTQSFVQTAAVDGLSATAKSIAGGDVAQVIADIERGIIPTDKALELYESAVEQGVAIPEKLKQFKDRLAGVEAEENFKPEPGMRVGVLDTMSMETNPVELVKYDKQMGRWEYKDKFGNIKDVHESQVRMLPEDRRTADTPQKTERREGERRTDFIHRKRVSEMDMEEREIALKTSELTGLKNKRAYKESEKKELQASLDIDSLKWVNDNFGHTTGGDALLKLIGAAFQGNENVYHVSGDEFIIQGTQKEIDAAAAKAKAYLKAHPMILAGSPFTPKFSYATDKDFNVADKKMLEEKLAREMAGKRAQRGDTPPDWKRPEGWISHAEKEAEAKKAKKKPQTLKKPSLSLQILQVRFSHSNL